MLLKIRRLMRPRFKYPIDSQWPMSVRSTIITRLAARITARMIYHSMGETYQFGGYTGILMEKYEMVDADKFQLIHWILREAGYSCCPADLMKECGIDPDGRRASKGPHTKGDFVAVGEYVNRHI